MSTVLIDSATAARLTGAQTTVEVRTEDGKSSAHLPRAAKQRKRITNGR
jgi:hypothetical protein